MNTRDTTKGYVGTIPVNRLYRGRNLITGYDSAITTDHYWFFTRALQRTGFFLPNPFSQIRIKTSATSININWGTTTATTSSNFTYATLGVFVNGVYNQTITPQTADVGLAVNKIVALPSGAKEVWFQIGVSEGLTNNLADVTGQFINSITSLSGEPIVFLGPQYKNNVLLVNGDSIPGGVGTTRPELNGHINLMRNDSRFAGFDVYYMGFASDATSKSWDTNAKIDTEVSQMASVFNRYTGDKVAWYEKITNDYGGGFPSATTDFTNRYTYIVDSLHAQVPAVRSILQTAFARTDKTAANSAGATLENLRQAMRDIVTARPAYTMVVEGSNIAGQQNLIADKVHYNDSGNIQMGEMVLRYVTGTYLANVGPVGQVASFSGAANSNIKFTSATLNPAGKTDFSYKVRSKLNSISSATTDWIIGFGDVNALNSILAIGFNASTKAFRVNLQGVGNIVLSTVNFVDLNYHDYEFRRKGMLLSFYQDDLLLGSYTLTSELTTNNNVYLGANVVGSTFNYGSSKMDNLRLYVPGLTDASSLADRNTDNLTNLTNILAAYNFTGDATDITGNGNNGVVGAAVTFPTS